MRSRPLNVSVPGSHPMYFLTLRQPIAPTSLPPHPMLGSNTTPPTLAMFAVESQRVAPVHAVLLFCIP